MRYIIITHTVAFTTDKLLFPDWVCTYAIIDTQEMKIVHARDWKSPAERPTWKLISQAPTI